MMPTVLALVALILALIDQLAARGRSILAWAVICLALALVWGKLA